MKFLKALTEAPGVPGREERVRDVIQKETKGLFDEWREDPMGNVIGICRADGKRVRAKSPRKVMLACHLDEIGFYVKFIDDDGFLRIQNVGGFDTRNLFSRRVLVQGRKDLVGILNPCVKPVHISSEEDRRKVPEISEFYVDLFMKKEEVEKLVQIGDPVTLLQETLVMGDVVIGKALDNRVATWVAINALRRVKGRSPFEIYYVGSAQEEVGCRGAQVAAFGIDPDDGIAIDIGLACDTPGIPKDQAVTRFGAGVALTVMDALVISTPSLLDEFIALAKRRKIPYQLNILPKGGTDGGAIQRAGRARRAFTLSIPVRYAHTAVETVHRRDLKAAVDLLSAWLTNA